VFLTRRVHQLWKQRGKAQRKLFFPPKVQASERIRNNQRTSFKPEKDKFKNKVKKSLMATWKDID